MLPRIFPFDYRETKEIAAKIKQAGECYFGLPFQTSEPPSQFSDPAPDSAKYWSRKKKTGNRFLFWVSVRFFYILPTMQLWDFKFKYNKNALYQTVYKFGKQFR